MCVHDTSMFHHIYRAVAPHLQTFQYCIQRVCSLKGCKVIFLQNLIIVWPWAKSNLGWMRLRTLRRGCVAEWAGRTQVLPIFEIFKAKRLCGPQHFNGNTRAHNSRAPPFAKKWLDYTPASVVKAETADFFLRPPTLATRKFKSL